MADLYRKSSVEKLSNPEQLDRAIIISSPMSWLALLAVFLIAVTCCIWAFAGKLPVMQTVSGVIASPGYAGAVYSDQTGTVTEILCSPGETVSKGDTLMTIAAADGETHALTAPQDGTVNLVFAESGALTAAGTEVIRYTPSVGAQQIVVCYVPADSAAVFRAGMKAQVSPLFADSGKYGSMEAEIVSVGSYAADVNHLGYVLGTDNMTAEMLTANGAVTEIIMSLKTDSTTASGYRWSGKKGRELTIPNGTMITANVITEETAPAARLLGNMG